jgi:glycosyltransferase involved in cell wall biosynthesis
LSNISIIIPAFNVAPFIGQTLDSVLSNKADMDIVVVDDVSTDETCAIVEQYMTRHPNIRLLRSDTNTGPGIARNRALKIIDSEYCLFQDADDILAEGAIDTVIALMDETNVDVSVFRHALLRRAEGPPEDVAEDTRKIWEDALGGRESAVLELEKASQFLLMANYPWNKIFRTSFIRRIGLRFSHARVNQDILPHWAAYMQAGRFLAINRTLAIHRLVPGREQITSIFDERRLEIFTALKDTEKLFDDNRTFREKYFHLFLFFKWGMLRWTLANLRPDLRGIFLEHVSHSYRTFTDEDFARIYRHTPELALSIHRVKYAPSTMS